MKNLLIEGLEKTQDGLTKSTLKGAATMVLGSLAMGIGINVMMKGQEKMVKSSTMNEMLDVVKEGIQNEEEA